MSLGSVNPKIPTTFSEYGLSSSAVIAPEVPIGASFTGVTLTVSSAASDRYQCRRLPCLHCPET